MANAMLWVAKLTVKLCGPVERATATEGVIGGGKESEEGEAEVVADKADEGRPVGVAEGGADATVVDALEEGVEVLDGAAASTGGGKGPASEEKELLFLLSFGRGWRGTIVPLESHSRMYAVLSCQSGGIGTQSTGTPTGSFSKRTSHAPVHSLV